MANTADDTFISFGETENTPNEVTAKGISSVTHKKAIKIIIAATAGASG